MHSALKKAPKTPIEAINRIRRHLKSGKIVRGRYQRGNCFCAIGIFFTPAQLEQINDADRNYSSVYYLTKVFGTKNIEAMTGLPLADLQLIQREFDMSSRQFTMLHRALDHLELKYQYKAE